MLATILQIPECTIETVQVERDAAIITLTSSRKQGKCPRCQHISTSVHSYYHRHPADLPLCGLRVQLRLRSQRFRCVNEQCPQKTFCARLAEWLPAYARRTTRLAETLHAAGLTAGGQAGSSLLQSVHIVASRDTVLRTLRTTPLPERDTPRVLGMDDWALRKGQTYGTILVDLEKHRVVDLLPDRQAETVSAWLQDHPGVEIVTRDRSGAYATGISQGAPAAEQVADRFHLLQNLTETTAHVMQRYAPEIKATLQGQTSNHPEAPDAQPVLPVTITAADMRRMARVQEVHRLHEVGQYQSEIACQLHISRKTVHRYLQMAPEAVMLQRRPRRSLITPFVPYLHTRWQAGCRNRMQLYREIKGQGYTGTASNVRKYLRQWSKRVGQDRLPHRPIPGPRTLAWLVTQPPEAHSAETQALIEQVQRAHAQVAVCMGLARQFAALVRQGLPERLTAWVHAAQASGLSAFASLAKSLMTDERAVRAALESAWSNGPTEGFINKLKCVKRQMYGRAKLDLLKIRLLALTP
jgi:transposase